MAHTLPALPYDYADLDDFVGKTLAEESTHHEWPRFEPHVTKIVRLPSEGVCFPLKFRYDKTNLTLEGREEVWAQDSDLSMFPDDDPENSQKLRSTLGPIF